MASSVASVETVISRCFYSYIFISSFIVLGEGYIYIYIKREIGRGWSIFVLILSKRRRRRKRNEKNTNEPQENGESRKTKRRKSKDNIVIMNKTAYDILEVDMNASSEMIRNSYLRLARKYHPDKNLKDTKNMFLNVQKSYDTLKNPDTKETYDNSLKEALKKTTGSGAITEIDLDDMEYEGTTFFTECRCGSKIHVSEEDLDAEIELFPCEGCSMTIRVLYAISTSPS